MKTLFFLIIVTGALIGVSADGSSNPRPCSGDADCFAEAVRVLNSGDVASAHLMLLQLTQQSANSPWAGRAALLLGRYYQQHGDSQAIVFLLGAQRQLPVLGDYAYYYLGEALFGSSEWNGSASAYELLGARYSDSLLRPQALYRAAEAWFQGEDCRRARDRQAAFLSAYPRHPLAPAVLLRQGDCEQKSGDRQAAIATYRRIWTQFARAPQATQAAYRLQAFKDMGVDLPQVTPQELWSRGKALFDAGQHAAAVPVLVEALGTPRGLADRPQALLTLGIAHIRLKQYDEARPLLAELIRNRSGAVSQDAALWLARVYLRQGQEEPLLALAAEVDAGLLSGDAKAKFLLLLAAAHVDRERTERAISTYRRAANVTGAGATAADALWQIGWLHYREGRYAEAVRAFEESRLQPGPSVLQALYWKARSLEKMGQQQKALETVQSICNEARYSYYCQIARTRTGWTELNGGESAGLNRVILTEAPEPRDPALMTDLHYQRATELRLLGWHREAAEELLALTARVGQDRPAALWLAGLLNATGETHQALSLIRTFFADLIERGGPAVSQGFWQLAYPGGYFPVIDALPAGQVVDAYLVTAVMREESAYNPSAVSVAGALGLMQIMPQTGQKIAAQLDAQPFNRDRLFEPCYNIRVGSWYLRHLVEKFGNNLAYVIAAYNAGPEVVSRWVQQAAGKDQDEFIESIPYTETRNYVKKVLRSYGEYKRIFEAEGARAALTGSAEPGIVRCGGSRVIE